MGVNCLVVGKVVVDDHGELFDVYTPRGDVGCDEYAGTFVGKLHHHIRAVNLLKVAVNGQSIDLFLAQVSGDLLRLELGVAKDDDIFGLIAGKDLYEHRQFLFLLQLVKTLRDRVGALGRDGLNIEGVFLDGGTQLHDLFGISGRKEKGLTLLGHKSNHPVDLFDEAHVEHAVRLVKYQRVQSVKEQRALVQVRQDSAGRAHNDVRPMAQGAELGSEGHTAAEREYLDVVRASGQTAKLFGDLVGEFARRTEHQRLHLEIFDIELVQQAYAEGGRLAASGLGLRNNIGVLQDRRQALCLYRGHLFKPEFVQVVEHLGAKRKA